MQFAFILIIALTSMFNINLVIFYFGIGLYLVTVILSSYYFIRYYRQAKNIYLITYYIIFAGMGYLVESTIDSWLRSKVDKHAIEIFKILNNLKIKYHLICGTLLFFYRDKTFMDSDIDLGIWKDDFKKIDFKLLKENGFEIIEAWKIDGKWGEVSLKYKKYNIQVDFFVLEKNKTLIKGIHEKKQIIITREKPLKYAIEKIKYKGTSIYIPKDSDKFLTWLYGEWRVPKPFHWLRGNEDITPIVLKKKITYFVKEDAYDKLIN